MSALTKVYEQLAIERKHECTGCEAKYQLTHSHIVPRSQDKSLETVKENIVYHCTVCHPIWEHSPNRVFLKDFQANMIYMYKANQSFYWLRVFKMQTYWEKTFDLTPNVKQIKDSAKALEILKELFLKTQAIHMGIVSEKIEN